MKNSDWMKSLADYYETVREEFQGQHEYRNLIVLFDIDGTILDHRKTIYHLLKRYDRLRGTSIFSDLQPEDIYVSQDHLNRLLDQYELAEDRKDEIIEFYDANRWTEDVILESHQPYQGVMDVIRWFQLQPNTRVGLNTARPEELRRETLESLNTLGRKYKVSFDNELLHMNDSGWRDAIDTKIEGIRYFEDRSYRVVAMLDNEPANLSALSDAEFENDFLLLHAETCFDSDAGLLPDTSLSGQDYGVTGLIQSDEGTPRTQFVWDGIDSTDSLMEFLNSTVQWGKLTVRRDPETGELILRSRNFNAVPRKNREPLRLRSALEHVKSHDKSVQLELKIERSLARAAMDAVRTIGIASDRLSFRLELDEFERYEEGSIWGEFDETHREIPVDFMQKLILGEGEKARLLLGTIADWWDVDRFSVKWQTYGKRQIVERLKKWGFSVNLTDIPGLEEFLGAEKLDPNAVTLAPTFTDSGEHDGASEEQQLPGQLFQ